MTKTTRDLLNGIGALGLGCFGLIAVGAGIAGAAALCIRVFLAVLHA